MQLFDYNGRPIKPPARPETREIGGVVSIRDRWSSYPSRGLTPGRLAQIFEAADYGDLRAQADLFTEMRRKDLHLHSVAGTRRLAVLGLEWQVEDASEDAQDKKIAQFCREQLKNLKLEALLKHLLGAVGHGYAGAEILWRAGDQAVIRGFNFIHPKNITFVNSPEPLVVTEDNWQGVKPAPFKLAFHLYEAESGYDTPTGVFRVCAYMYLFKNYAIKDWAAFNEVFGMPLRLGKYEPSATPADKEALRAAISSLGSDAAGIISKSTEIEFVEAASRLSGTTNPYQVMASFCNREMSKGVLGQTLTTDTEGSTGTYSAGKVQQEVRRDLLEADAEAVSETIRYQLLYPLVGFNFGWDVAEKGLPDFSLMLQEEQDLVADSQVIKNLKEAGAGKCITEAHVIKHFGFPEPKPGEKTLGDVPEVEPEEVQGKEKGPGARGQGSDKKEKAALKAEPGAPVLVLKDGEGYVFENNGTGEFGSLPEDQEIARNLLELENLARAAQDTLSGEMLAGMLAPLKAVIAQGGTPAELRAKLLAAFKTLDVSGYAEHLSQALVLAELKGRAQ